MEQEVRKNKMVRVTLLGSAVNAILIFLKFAGGILGHSSAMIADAVHSLSDFATDLVVLFFIRISSKPQDEDHKYGHGKFEILATALIGLVLWGVGLKLLWESGNKIYGYYVLDRELVSPGKIAWWAALISIICKELLFRYTRRAGQRVQSPSLVANAWHHRSDAFSSLATALGIGGAIILGPRWNILDPLAAVIVSALIIKVAFQLFLPAIDELLEKSLPAEIESDILTIIAENPKIHHPHNLRTRRIGNNLAIDVHVRVDGSMSVAEAHLFTRQIENNLRLRYGPGTCINIHVEPVHSSDRYPKK
ncbi:MAG: cation diffusion facilitator family transporter [Rikenellaceae bacterium]|nr:cation diffusion facilitator family transporter [Rikenellaceae bacterium]